MRELAHLLFSSLRHQLRMGCRRPYSFVRGTLVRKWLTRILLPLSILLACGPALAAVNTTDGQPAGPPLQRAEADHYAQQLGRIIEQVRETYFRPIARAELAAAAVHGLYGAARLPMSPALHAEILKAGNDVVELQRLLVRIRENLGNLESLRGPQAILAS